MQKSPIRSANTRKFLMRAPSLFYKPIKKLYLKSEEEKLTIN